MCLMGNWLLPHNVEHYRRGFAQTEVVISDLNCVWICTSGEHTVDIRIGKCTREKDKGGRILEKGTSSLADLKTYI